MTRAHSDYQRVYVTSALSLYRSRDTYKRVEPILDAAMPSIVGYTAEYRVSDLDTFKLMSTLDHLVDLPTRRMINTLPQRNFHLSCRKLLSVVACAAHVADHINTFALEYQLPIPQAIKRASLRRCNVAMLEEAALDLSGTSPDGLDARAIGIIRRVAEEALMRYHGHAQEDVRTYETLLAYMGEVFRLANLQSQ